MKMQKLILAAMMAACLPAMANPAAPMAMAHARAMVGPLMIQHGKVVKNAPYSAQVVSEQIQNLADGNQISVKNITATYRDSAGRTRLEMADASGELRNVTIRDPENGTYILRPQQKTATRIAAPREIARVARERAHERIEQLRKDGKLPAEREAIIVKRIDKAIGAPGAEAHGFGPGLDARIAGAFADRKWSAKAETRELGSREFGGVKAEGKVRSYEIPAGEVGNRHPISVSQETWFSPELQVTVYTRHSDPRSGENTYRLENIKREEPAASLFAVPSDYTVVDAMARLKMRTEEKK